MGPGGVPGGPPGQPGGPGSTVVVVQGQQQQDNGIGLRYLGMPNQFQYPIIRLCGTPSENEEYKSSNWSAQYQLAN